MVPIPEGVERDEEEPENETFGDITMSDGGDDRREKLRLCSGIGIPDRDRITLKKGEEEEIRG